MVRPYEVEIRGTDEPIQPSLRRTKKSIQDIEDALRLSTRAGGDAMAMFKGMTVSRLVVDAVYRVKAALEAMVQKGIEYNASMESSRLGIASIIASQTTILDQDGRLLRGREALNAALQQAGVMMAELEKAGLETSATTQQLVEAFQNAVGPATAMGLSLAETKEITLGIVQAAGALGVPMYQLNEEVRSIVGGTINMNSRVAKALGLSNEMVRTWAEQGTLAQKLIGILGTYRLAGQDVANTWSGLLSNMSEVFAKAAGTALKGPFDDIKEGMKGVLDSVIQTKDGTVQLSPALQDVKEWVDLVWAGFKDLLTAVGNFVPWTTVRDIVMDIGRLVAMIGRGWKEISESWVGTYIKKGLEGIYKGWQLIGVFVEGGTAGLDRMEAAQNRVTTAAQGTAAAMQSQAQNVARLGEDKIKAYADAFEKAREFIEKERGEVRKLEEEKIELARKSSDLKIEQARRELDYKRKIADFDKSEKQLERELAILQGTAKPLTAQEEKKQKIAEIEERLTRLQEDRRRATEDNTTAAAKAAEEAAKLKTESEDVDKKWKQATAALKTVEGALAASSQGALTFNESLAKTVVTANELAKALLDAGRIINAYNAKLPERGPASAMAFDYKSLEKRLQDPMAGAADAATRTQQKMTDIKGELPSATREMEAQRKEWERINSQADEHLKKLERIKYAMREWGFRMEGINPEAEGAYAPGY